MQMTVNELERKVNNWCNMLEDTWQNKINESVPGKIKMLADLHPIHLYSDMEEYNKKHNNYNGQEIIKLGEKYRTMYNEIAYHVIQQYAMKKLSTKWSAYAVQLSKTSYGADVITACTNNGQS